MLSILIGALFGGLFGFYRRAKGKFYADFVGRWVAPFTFPIMAGLFIGFFVGTFTTPFLPRHDVVTGPISLVSMRSVDGASGTFVFGSGSIGNAGSYGYYVLDTDGTLVPNSVPADSASHIREDAKLHGKAYLTITTRGPDMGSIWAKYFALIDHNAFEVVRREFHVPAGTVVQDFRVR